MPFRQVIGFLLIVSFLFSAAISFSAAPPREARGLWVECEGSQETLFSREKIDEMISRARSAGFNLLFIQIYRHDRAWFNSRFADAAPYRQISRKEKIDPLAYIIEKAHKSGLEVHAWLNMFRIGREKNAPVLKRLGGDAITRDGMGKSLLFYPAADLPDGGYWLDPGDRKVQGYLLGVIEEIIGSYPSLDGIHLDFVRYPYLIPLGGSLWAGRKDLGYGKDSVARFQEWSGLDPLKMELTRSNCQAWDNWRRHQVNSFVSSVYRLARSLKPKMKVSAAVVAWADRAYLSSFQDWRRWLEEGTVDFIAIMNYSTDPRLARYLTYGALASPNKRQVYVGLGAYLLLDNPQVLYEQVSDCRKAGAPGIALFSYDAMCQSPEIFSGLKNKIFSQPVAPPEMPWK